MTPIREGPCGAGNAGRDVETGSAGSLRVSAGNVWNSPHPRG